MFYIPSSPENAFLSTRVILFESTPNELIRGIFLKTVGPSSVIWFWPNFNVSKLERPNKGIVVRKLH